MTDLGPLLHVLDLPTPCGQCRVRGLMHVYEDGYGWPCGHWYPLRKLPKQVAKNPYRNKRAERR